MTQKAFSFLLKYDTKKVRIFSIILGLPMGFLYAIWAFGKHVGDEGLIPNIRIHFGDLQFLAHHWLMFSIYSLIIYWYFRRINRLNYMVYFIIAFLIGAVLQGFTYSDWYILFK